MNENIIPVNNDALSRALIAVVGEQTAAVIVKSYHEIDKAMAAGYEAGFKAAQEASNKQADEAFSKGRKQGDEDQWEDAYAKGHTDGYVSGFEDGGVEYEGAYDDGYIDGVSDARVCPSDADARVAELCSEDDAEVDFYDDQADEDGFDGTYDTSDGAIYAQVSKREHDLRMAQLQY